jgi:DDE superfamily endonuclease
MESCYKLPLEDSRDRGPLPWFGGDDRERPAADAAAAACDSLKGALPDPQRWGRSAEAIGPLGERLYEFWQRFHGCFKTSTRDTSGHAYASLRGQLTMDGERNFANMARNRTGDDGQALQHCMSNSPGSGPGVFRQMQAESTATPALAQGSTLILDESADEKAGTHNAGASRQ